MIWTLQRKQSTQVGWSLRMLGSLPPLVEDPTTPAIAEVAAIDAFLSHARCIGGFLIGKRDERDIHRYDFLPGWDLDDRALRDKLGRLVGLATTHVSHLSKARVPESDSDAIRPIGRSEMTTLAEPAFRAFALFVHAMHQAGAELADQMGLYLDDALPPP